MRGCIVVLCNYDVGNVSSVMFCYEGVRVSKKAKNALCNMWTTPNILTSKNSLHIWWRLYWRKSVAAMGPPFLPAFTIILKCLSPIRSEASSQSDFRYLIDSSMFQHALHYGTFEYWCIWRNSMRTIVTRS